MTAARLAELLTSRPVNKRIIGVLGPDSEVLTDIRDHFITTIRMFANFKSSTFQESKGFSNTIGFQGKVSSAISALNNELTVSGC